jgi:hypothetical protein
VTRKSGRVTNDILEGRMNEQGAYWRATHNGLGEAVRIVLVEVASVLLAALTMPWPSAAGEEAMKLSIAKPLYR